MDAMRGRGAWMHGGRCWMCGLIGCMVRQDEVVLKMGKEGVGNPPLAGGPEGGVKGAVLTGAERGTHLEVSA